MKLNEIQSPTKPRIYLDMDGVIADFVAGITTILDEPYDEEAYKTDSKYRSKMWKAVREYSKQGGKLWLNLPMMRDAQQLWDYIKDYDVQILSATGDPKYGAAEQKIEWIKKFISPSIKVNLVRMSKEKAGYAKEGDILIDDQPKSINPWKAVGGVGILHTDAASTINKLKALDY